MELGIGKSLDELLWRPLATIRESKLDTLEGDITVEWDRKESPIYAPESDCVVVFLEDPQLQWDGPYLFAARGEGVLHAWSFLGGGQEDDHLAAQPGYRSTDLWYTIMFAPAYFPQVMTIGAVADTTGWGAVEEKRRNRALEIFPVLEHGRLLPFSARGPSPYGGTKPDFVAPGMAWTPGMEGEQDYVHRFGTSFSSPWVAGTVAAFLERFPEATREEVYEALAQSARPLDDQPVPNNLWGYGQVDLAGALAFHEKKTATVVAWREETGAIPVALQNAPNPFNAGTTLSYRLERGQHVRLHIYNVLGQQVDTLGDEYQASGSHRVYWHPGHTAGQGLASGVYFARLFLGDRVQTAKLLLVR